MISKIKIVIAVCLLLTINSATQAEIKKQPKEKIITPYDMQYIISYCTEGSMWGKYTINNKCVELSIKAIKGN